MDHLNEPQTPQFQSNIPKNKQIGQPKSTILYRFGILIGVLVVQKSTDFIPAILPTLMAVFISFFLANHLTTNSPALVF